MIRRQLFTKTITESIDAANINLGEVFGGLSSGEIERINDTTVTVKVSGNLANTGTGTITIDKSVIRDCNTPLLAEVTVTEPEGGDSQAGGGLGRSVISQDNTVVLTPNESSKPLNLEFPHVKITIIPETISDFDEGELQVVVSEVTDPATLNKFFIGYPDQKGIMKGYSITFTKKGADGSYNS